MKKFLILAMGLACSADIYATEIGKTVSNSSYKIVLQSLKSDNGKEYINSSVKAILGNPHDYKITTNLPKDKTYELSYVCFDGKKIVNIAKCDLDKESIKLWDHFPNQKGGEAKIDNYALYDYKLVIDLETKEEGYVEIVTTSLTNHNVYTSNVFFITNN